jgi:hypothetical protein
VASRRCMFGYGRKSRCRNEGTERIERPKTLAHYCENHARQVQRIYAGAGRGGT